MPVRAAVSASRPPAASARVADAARYIELVDECLGAHAVAATRFRIGASALLGDIQRVLGGTGTADTAARY